MMLLAPAIPWSLPEIRDIFAGPPRLLEAWIFGTAGLTVYAAHRWLGWRHAAPAVVAGRVKCNPPGAMTE